MDKDRFSCEKSDICVIEISKGFALDNFITIFLRQTLRKEQIEKEITENLKDLIGDNYHNDKVFHREADWPLWAKQNTLHYHIRFSKQPTNIDILATLTRIDNYLEPEFAKSIKGFYGC